MALKRGDILDERKRFPDSCGLVVKIMGVAKVSRRSSAVAMS